MISSVYLLIKIVNKHLYLACMTVLTTNKIYKPNDILRSKCTGTIGNPKPACTSLYDGRNP